MTHIVKPALADYAVTYRMPGYPDVTLTVDHLPMIGSVAPLPDGSGRYGRVIAAERKENQ